jgi:O-antigen/teichoic acid export membrane protein
MAVAISATVFFLCFGREILAIFAAPAFHAAAAIIPILVATSFVSSMYLFNPGLPLQKKTVILSAINIAGAAANIGLNFALVPRLGILGAALSSTTSALLRYLLNYAFSQRHYPVRFAWGRIWWVLLAAGIVAALLVVGRRHGRATGIIPRISVFAGVSTLSVLVLAGRELRTWARRARGVKETD